MESQTKLILNHLKEKPITSLEALNLYGCLRLSARILDIKNQGYKITSQIIKSNSKHFSQYTLVTE